MLVCKPALHAHVDSSKDVRRCTESLSANDSDIHPVIYNNGHKECDGVRNNSGGPVQRDGQASQQSEGQKNSRISVSKLT